MIPQVASSVKNVPWAGQPITRTHDELLANMGRAKSDIAPRPEPQRQPAERQVGPDLLHRDGEQKAGVARPTRPSMR